MSTFIEKCPKISPSISKKLLLFYKRKKSRLWGTTRIPIRLQLSCKRDIHLLAIKRPAAFKFFQLSRTEDYQLSSKAVDNGGIFAFFIKRVHFLFQIFNKFKIIELQISSSNQTCTRVVLMEHCRNLTVSSFWHLCN